MRYKGGKFYTGKKIAKLLGFIFHSTDCKIYVEPFCGSLNVIKHINWTCNKIASDLCLDIIMLHKSVQNQTFDYPDKISKEEWNYYKKSTTCSSMRAYYGFGLSYAGSWFSSYSPQYNAPVSLNKSIKIKRDMTKDVIFNCCDYSLALDEIGTHKCLIYCDIPYTSTHIIYGASHDFDIERFWYVCDNWKEQGHVIVVSNTHAPNHWTLISESSTQSKVGNTIYNDNLYILGI